MSDALAINGEATLAELEATIERGLDAWIEAALAWEEIRRERRYLESGYSDFDTYTRERWGKRRETIDRMIRSAQTIEQLNPIGLTSLPANESQARELARIPDAEARAEVWRTVTEQHGERVTAKHIRDAIRSEESPPYDPPLLSVVDLETGEVVTEPDIIDAAYEIADDAGKSKLDRLNYLAQLSRTMSLATGLLAYEPERVAQVIDPEFKRIQIDVIVERITDWANRIEHAMPRELRAIKGGRGD